MVSGKFNKLPSHYQALVIVGVLLDGIDAEAYLQNDYDYGDEMVGAAQSFIEMAPEMRVPLLGTLLRQIKD